LAARAKVLRYHRRAVSFLELRRPGPRCDVQLAARDGRPISNSVEPDPSPGALELARRSDKVRFALQAASSLHPATGRYNCHGLVFAARRANVPAAGEDIDIAELLRADGYQRITSEPRPGDVAAYVDPRGEIEHTGFVNRVEHVGTTPVVHVWSAWGVLGEFSHRAESSPYSSQIQYWRLT
jgi:hypothetical protein